MTRTKKATQGRPYRYRQHNHQQGKYNKRSMKRSIRMSNRYADEVQFMSISKICGKIEPRGPERLPGLLFGGKSNIKKAWEAYEDDELLAEAACKQLSRRGRLGVFLGHKDKHHQYKRELVGPNQGF